jgi:hypothetical protein
LTQDGSDEKTDKVIVIHRIDLRHSGYLTSHSVSVIRRIISLIRTCIKRFDPLDDELGWLARDIMAGFYERFLCINVYERGARQC